MTARPNLSGSVPMYTHELTISAVSYDAMLVEELSDRLARRLGAAPFWDGRLPVAADAVTTESALFENSSRLTVLLHQRLWQHERATQADAVAIVHLLRGRPNSVRVILLDAEPVPQWLADVPQCSLSAVGLDGVTDFIVDAVVACGGVTQRAFSPVAIAPAEPAPLHTPPVYLAQPRALSALRQELDALAAALTPRTSKSEPAPDPVTEFQSLPNRFVLQIGPVGLSFSWVAGRTGTVADGRLLVIEWDGVVARRGGRGAVPTAARAVRERIYKAEATERGGWRWRVDDPNGRAFSTANLAAEWLAGAAIASA